MNLWHRLKLTILNSVLRRVSRQALRSGTLGLGDQSIISALNFLVMVAAARELGPSAFGQFALLFMVFALIEAIQTSLVTAPHNVMGATKEAGEYRHYTGTVATIQVALSIGVAGLLALAAIVAGQLTDSFGTLLFTLAIASIGVQWQEFIRRVLYTEDRVAGVLVNDIVTYGLRAGLLAALVVTGGVTGARIFLLLGVSSAAGALFGIWQIRRSLALAFDSTVLREHWRFGRWICAGRVVAHGPQYIAAAVLSAVLSLGAFGAYRAAYQLVHATNVPINALDSLSRPRLAVDATKGPHAMWRTMQPILILGGLAFFGFAVVLIVFRETLLEWIYGPEFAVYSAVVLVLAFRPLASLPERLFSNALQAVRTTRPFFTAKVFGAVVGSGIGSLAVVLLELPAAGAIVVLTTLTSAAWLAWTWKVHAGSGSRRVGRAESSLETQIVRRSS